MRIEPKNYALMIGGWKACCDSDVITRYNVGLFVKASGHNPTPGVEQKPEKADYGVHAVEGWQPNYVDFPVKHAHYYMRVHELVAAVRLCWAEGRTVFFHCNKGQVRAPAAVLVFLGAATGKPPIQWLPTIGRGRDIAAFYLQLHYEHETKGNTSWFPRNFDDFILACRVIGSRARLEDFRRLMGQVASVPGTPRTYSDRLRNREETCFAATPIRGDETPDEVVGTYVDAPEVANRPDPAPLILPPSATSLPPRPHSPRTPPVPRATQPLGCQPDAYVTSMAAFEPAVKSPLPGDNTYSVYHFEIAAGNTAAIPAGNYTAILAGWKVGCDADVINEYNVGAIVKASGSNPREWSQKPDRNQYAVNIRTGCQPHILEFPIKHAEFWKGLYELTGVVRNAWELGKTVLFHCNHGQYRAPTALVVFMEIFTGTPKLSWLSTILEQRVVAGFLHETHARNVVQGDMTWSPPIFNDFLLWCRIHYVECSWKYFCKMHHLDVPNTGALDPREEDWERRLLAEAADVSPCAPDIGLVPNARGVDNPSRDPAPELQPPFAQSARSLRRGSISPRRPRRRTPPGTPPWPRRTPPGTPPWPPATPFVPGTPPWPPATGLPMWKDRSPPPSPPPGGSQQPSSRGEAPYYAVTRAGGSGAPAHFGSMDSDVHLPCTVQAGKPMRASTFPGLDTGRGVVNPASPPPLPESIPRPSLTPPGSPRNTAPPCVKANLPTRRENKIYDAPSLLDAGAFDVGGSDGRLPTMMRVLTPVNNLSEQAPSLLDGDRFVVGGDYQRFVPDINLSEQPPSLLDGDRFDVGGYDQRLPTGDPGLTTLEEGLGDAPGEPANRVPPEVAAIRWDENPQIMVHISDGMISDDLRALLRYIHGDVDAGLPTWSYNMRGYHASHCFINAMHEWNFPEGHEDFWQWTQPTKDEWVYKLFCEVVSLTVRQYGTCTPRTHGNRPANNTPLMMLSKGGYPNISDQCVHRMLTHLMTDGIGKPGLVDNRHNNCVMMAAGQGNKVAWDFYHQRAYHLSLYGFDWAHENIDHRNVLGLVKSNPQAVHILASCKDLCRLHYFVDKDPNDNLPCSGQSSANRRQRSQSRSGRQWVGNPPRGGTTTPPTYVPWSSWSYSSSSGQ